MTILAFQILQEKYVCVAGIRLHRARNKNRGIIERAWPRPVRGLRQAFGIIHRGKKENESARTKTAIA